MYTAVFIALFVAFALLAAEFGGRILGRLFPVEPADLSRVSNR